MRKRWTYAIQLVLSLIIITALAVGCAGSPSTSAPDSTAPPTVPSSKSTSTPPASEYPADISGHVTIADKVIVQGRTKKMEQTPLGNDKVWWIIEVSVKNNDYDYPISSIWDKSIPMPKGIASNIIWSIIIDGKRWSGLEQQNLFVPPSMSVSKGQSGKTTFLFDAKNINPGDAEICYAGEEPYSYGKLIGGEKVAVYDWDLKRAVPEELAKTTRTVRIIQHPEFAGAKGIVGTWEFTLNSYNIRSTTVDINITITSRHDAISEYSLSRLGEFVVIDQYGGGFVDVKRANFYAGRYYPKDSRTGNLQFTVNLKSGKISLWLIPSQLGTLATYNRYKLFDLGEIK